jgi:hypothetical protein
MEFLRTIREAFPGQSAFAFVLLCGAIGFVLFALTGFVIHRAVENDKESRRPVALAKGPELRPDESTRAADTERSADSDTPVGKFITLPPAPRSQGDRIYLSVTSKQLHDAIDGLTDADAERTIKGKYAGRWLRVRGVISNVTRYDSVVGEFWQVSLGHYDLMAKGEIQRASALFSAEHAKRIAGLHRGDIVTVDGKVMKVEADSVSIGESELVTP